MRIKLYDRGLPKGKKLYEDLKEVCKRLQIEFDPEYSKDMNKIYSQGATGQTILTINNEIVLVDQYPDPKELEKILTDYL